MNQEKEMLEDKAELYLKPDDGRNVDRKVTQYIIEKIFPTLKGPKILGMGFGDDYWTDLVINAFGHIYIVDASEKLLKKAKKIYGHKLTTYLSLFETFEPEERFDTVLATFVLDHVLDPEKVLHQARKWLNDKGEVIIMVPNAGSIHRRLAVCMGLHPNPTDLGETDDILNHRRVFTIEKLEDVIRSAGLKPIQKSGALMKPLPQAMMANLPDAILKGFVDVGDEMPQEFCAILVYRCVKA